MKDARYHAYMIVYEFEISNKQLKSIRDSYYKKNNIPKNERNRSMVLSNEVVRWKKKLRKNLTDPRPKLISIPVPFWKNY